MFRLYCSLPYKECVAPATSNSPVNNACNALMNKIKADADKENEMLDKEEGY